MEVKVDILTMDMVKIFKPKFYEENFISNMQFNINHPYRDCYLLTFGDVTMAICGVNHSHGGAADLWMIPTVQVDNKPLVFFRVIKNFVDALIREDLHRLQMYIKENWGKGHKWARALGFKLEGIAQKYDGILDYACYARVR